MATRTDPPEAYALPLHLDVRHRGHRRTFVHSPDTVDLGDWKNNAEIWVQTARSRLIKESFLAGTNVIDELWQADVTIDAGPAGQIIAPFFDRLPVGGNSVSAAIAMGVGVRLLGLSLPPVAATGELAPPDKRGRSFIRPVGAFKPKTLAASGELVETLLVPIRNIREIDGIDKPGVTLQPVSTLDDMFDIVLQKRWRRARYVRCADIEW